MTFLKNDEYSNQITQSTIKEAAENVDSSIKFVKTVMFLKITIAALIIGGYFFQSQYLTEFMLFGVVLSLLLPTGFRDTYLEQLINLRSEETDARQILNATEANKHFSSAFERIDALERKAK